MFKQFSIVLLAMVLLCGCTAGGDKSTSSTAEESERTQWTETENFGNRVVTREYRDGENDYTVTVEVFNKDGSLRYKTVSLYAKKTLLEENRTDYDNEGNIENSTTTSFDKSGTIAHVEDIFVGEKYVIYRNVAYENGEQRDTEVRYESHDGQKMASGTERKITEEGTVCDESLLEVYSTSGDVHHIERRVLAEDGTYRRYEFCDVKGELLFSMTEKNNLVLYLISGENGGSVEQTGKDYVFYDAQGIYFAKAAVVDSEMTIQEVLGSYNDSIRLLQTLLEQSSEYMRAFSQGMIFPGKTWK